MKGATKAAHNTLLLERGIVNLELLIVMWTILSAAYIHTTTYFLVAMDAMKPGHSKASENKIVFY